MDPKDPIDQFHLRTLLTDVGDRSQAVKELKRLRHDAREWAQMREHAGPVRSDNEDPGPQQVDVVVDMSGDFEALAGSAETSLELAFQGNEILASLGSSLDSIAQDVAELPEIRRNTARMVSDLGWLKVQGLLHLAVATRSAFDLAQLRSAFKDFAEDFRNWGDDVLRELQDTRTTVATGFANTQDLLIRLAVHKDTLDEQRARQVVEQLHRVGQIVANEVAVSGRRIEARLEALLDVAKQPLRTQADELVRAARVELATGNSGGAMTLLRRAIDVYSVHPEAWLLAGAIRWEHDLHQTDAGDAFARSAACALYLREQQAYESAVLALAAWHASVGLDELDALDRAIRDWKALGQGQGDLDRVILERHAVSLDRWLASGAAPRDWPECGECVRHISRRDLWRQAIQDRRLRKLFFGILHVQYDEHDEIVDVDQKWGAVPYLWAGSYRHLAVRVQELLDALEQEGGFDGSDTIAELWMMLVRVRESMLYLGNSIRWVDDPHREYSGDTWFLDTPEHLNKAFRQVDRNVRDAVGKCKQKQAWLAELHAALCKTDGLLPQPVVMSAPMLHPRELPELSGGTFERMLLDEINSNPVYTVIRNEFAERYSGERYWGQHRGTPSLADIESARAFRTSALIAHVLAHCPQPAVANVVAKTLVPYWSVRKWRAYFGSQGPGPVWRNHYGRWLAQINPSWG